MTDNKKTIILFLLFLFCYPVLSIAKISIVFRYDDFLLKSDSINETVVRIFQKHDIPLVLGIIPCNDNEQLILEKDYSFMNTLKQGILNNHIEIALHGLNHKLLADGEFGHIPYSEQYRRIKTGKQYLDSIFNINTITFIPPWNAYDVNTLKAMQTLGMSVISSSFANQAHDVASINYIPHTVENAGELAKVLKKQNLLSGIIVVMFHRYDFNAHFTLSDLDHLLSEVQQHKNIHCETFSGLLQQSEYVNRQRLSANLDSNLLYKLLKLQHIIIETNMAIIIRLVNILLYCICCAGLYFLTILVLSKRLIIANGTILVSFVLLFMIVGLSVWIHLFSPLKLLLASSLFSVATATLAVQLTRHNKEQ